MDTALKLIGWCKQPHWTPKLMAWAFGVAVIFGWILTGTFFRGFGCVATLVIGWGLYRVVRWTIARRKAILDAGLPVSPIRMARDAVRERARFARVEKRWELACKTQRLMWEGKFPRLQRMEQTLAGDVRALVKPGSIGGDVESIAKVAASTLPGIMNCCEVTVQAAAKPGTAWITFLKSDPLDRLLPVTNLPAADRDKIAFGVQQDGQVAQVLMGISILVGGLTRAGKSSTVWAMLAGLNQRRIPVELYVSDGKGGMELQMFEQYAEGQQKVGNIRVMGYTTTAEGTVEMMERFAAGMMTRQKAIREAGNGRTRKVTTPTEEHPLRIFLMDELLAVKSTLKTTAGKTSHTELVINQGAASLDMVIALTQAAKVTQIGDLRDAFPLRLCFKVKTQENQKAILGDQSSLDCRKITDQQRGVGVYVTDSGEEMKFRSAYADDAQVEVIAAGLAPTGMAPYVPPGKATGAPCYVYRAFDKNNRLMYVGKSNNQDGVRARFKQHRLYDRKWCSEHGRVENWWKVHVDETKMDVFRCQSPEHMDAVEQHAIYSEMPRFNEVHNVDNPLANLDQRSGRGRRAKDAAAEYVELARDEAALRQVRAGYRKQDRIEQDRARRDQFVETALANRFEFSR